MKLDELTLGEIKQLAGLAAKMDLTFSTPSTSNDPDIGKYVIVRTYMAGVHVGVLKSRNGQEVVLTESRRIWRWNGANTLSEISLNGVASDSRVAEEVPSITLTQAIEIIPCSKAAEKNLRGAKWTK